MPRDDVLEMLKKRPVVNQTQSPTYSVEQHKAEQFPDYKKPSTSQWTNYVERQQVSKNKGIQGYQNWRNAQLQEGAGFRPGEVSPSMRKKFQPYKKNYWQPNDNGGYAGQDAWFEELQNRLTNEELPEGAKGWTPNGQPYYGGESSYQEWQLRSQATMELRDVTTSQEASFSDWDAPNLGEAFSKEGILGFGKALLAGGVEAVDQVNEYVDWTLGGRQQTQTTTSTAQNIYRNAMYNIKSPIMWALTQAEELEKVIGGVMNAGHFLEGKPTLSEFDAIEAKRLKDLGDPNWYAGAIIEQANREPTWANVKAEFWEGFKNSEWLYTAMWDNLKGDPTKIDIGNPFNPVGVGSIKIEQMKRELQADPSLNPYQLTEKYANPWTELIGESILDPLNLVGMASKPIMQGRRLAGAFKKYGRYGDEFMELLGRTGDDAKKFAGLAEDAASKLDSAEFVATRGRQMARIQDEVQQLADSKNLFGLTNGGKAHEYAMEFDGINNWVASVSIGEAGFDPEQYFEIVDLIRRSGGQGDEALEAWAELSKYKGWDTLLTDSGAKASLMFDDLAKSKSTIKKMLEADPEEFWQIADEFISGRTKKLFPTLAEQAKANPASLGPGYKAIAKFHEATRPFYNAINGAFSFVYLGVSPGYATRNLLQNNVQQMLDLGFGSVAKGYLTHGSEDLVKAWAGVGDIAKLIPGMKPGIGAAADIAGQNSKGLINWLANNAPMTKLANSFEDLSSVKIYGKVYPETMRKILNKRNIPAELVARGFDKKEADHIFAALMKNKGDVKSTMDELMNAAQKKYIRTIESDLGLTRDMVRFLDDTKLRDRYYELIKTSRSKASAKQAWDDLFTEFMDWAEQGVLREVPAAPHDADGLTKTLLRVTGDGAPRDVARNLTDHVTVNVQAVEEWRNAVDNLTTGWTDVLATAPGYSQTKAQQTMRKWLNEIQVEVADGQEIGVYDALLRGKFGQHVKREADMVFDRWGDLRDEAAILIKENDHARLAEIWQDSGLAALYGDYDPQTTNIIDKMWRGYEGEVRKLWGNYRDEFSAFGTEALEKVKANVEAAIRRPMADYQQQLSRARKSLERAQKWDGFLHGNEIRETIRRAKKNRDMRTALQAYARQFRIHTARVDGGRTPPLEKYIKKMDNPTALTNEELSDMTRLLVDAGYEQSANKFHKALYGAGDRLAVEAGEMVDEDALKAIDNIAAEARDLLQSISDKVRLESGGRMVSKDQYILNILNKQLNRSFKSMDEVTAEALTFNDARSALMAHALGERVKLFSNPEYGTGLVRRFLVGKMDDFTDEQLRNIDEMMRAFKLESPDGVLQLKRNKVEFERLAKQLEGAPDDVARVEKQEELNKLLDDMNKQLDEFENTLREREPEELASMVQESALDLEKPRSGEFTTWHGEAAPSDQRVYWEKREFLKQQAESIKSNIDARWDERIDFKANKAKLRQLEDAAKWMGDEVAMARRVSGEVARATRNFVLHDYKSKRNIDLVLGYLMPYSFWYTRTYAKWLPRIATNAGTISAYARYKRTLASIHHDMPEWWKYQINTNEILGLDSENPLFFNLEATLNPLNGVTGVDFNDPTKRTNWFTSAIDKIGKYGPSVYTPITLGIGYYYYLQGEQELAEKWGGRLMPQSQGIKSISALLGANEGKGIEIDPNVLIMGKGKLDLWERKRVGRALGWAVENGAITQEQALEAARTMEGAIWDNAVAVAQNKRAAGNISGMFLGIGFKARNQEDMKIDQMDAQFKKFMDMKSDLSPDEVAMGYDWFRQQYPFFDTVKLSRRGIDERDTGYTYNILSRVPPGMKNSVYKAFGITYEQTQEFYANKGLPEDWEESEKLKFMEGIIEMGAILALPENATKQEWREVKRLDSEMYNVLEQKYGEGMRDLEDQYWNIVMDEGYDAVKPFLAEYPALQGYMNDKNSYRLNDPLLQRYYASFDKARSLLWSRRQTELQTKFPNIQEKIDRYYDIKLEDAKAAKAFLKDNPEITEYWDYRDTSTRNMYDMLLSYETWLPEGDEIAQPVLRPDRPATPEAQEQVGQIMREDDRPQELEWTYEKWTSTLSPTLKRLVDDWARGGYELSRNAETSLEHALEEMDLDIPVQMAMVLIEESAGVSNQE